MCAMKKSVMVQAAVCSVITERDQTSAVVKFEHAEGFVLT
jgi:hypothetical protein